MVETVGQEMSNAFFITGTGTGIGKTLVTAAMTYQLRREERGVFALKPVISGWQDDDVESSDTWQLLKAMDKPLTSEHVEEVSPWRFKAPLSPDMAARKELRTIFAEEVADYCMDMHYAHPDDILLVEGVGGVMVPLNAKETMLDVMQQLRWPVVLVTGSYLGTLSHTLTAYQALHSRGLKLSCVIIMESQQNDVPLRDTQRSLEQFIPDIPMLAVPRLADKPQLWQLLPHICHLLVEK